MDRIDNVDLREALREIAENNTFSHLENDLNISLDQMEQAARLDDPAEKMMLWVSYPSGIDCYSERQAFQKDTRDYNGVQYHGKDGQRDRKLAYAVEVTGIKDGKVHGNLFQMDIRQYAETVRQSALVSNTKRLYTGDLRTGEQITMPKDEYDRRYPFDLPKTAYIRNEPDDPAALAALMERAAREREAEATPREFWSHRSDLYDDRRAFYSGQLMTDLAKLREANGPDRQSFTVPLNFDAAAHFAPEQLSQLLDALPYKTAAFTVEKGGHDMHLVVPRDEVLQHRLDAELREKLELTAINAVEIGMHETTEGNYFISFEEAGRGILPPETVSQYKDEIVELMYGHEAVADVVLSDEGEFDICFNLAFCPNYEAKQEEIDEHGEDWPEQATPDVKPSILAFLKKSQQEARQAPKQQQPEHKRDNDREV